jgi:hypothetical protein
MPRAAMRPMMSVPPPGANATIMRIGRVGYSALQALPAAASTASKYGIEAPKRGALKRRIEISSNGNEAAHRYATGSVG